MINIVNEISIFYFINYSINIFFTFLFFLNKHMKKYIKKYHLILNNVHLLL